MHRTVEAWAMVPQVEHDATLEDNEYKPGVHREHADAPAVVPLFVMEPAAHSMHDVCPL